MATSVGRRHIVLVPGFAGFDALGQLEYYAGVTDAYRTWVRSRGGASARPIVLHYFDNLPTAGVATRAERLRTYLAKRIARGEIQEGDSIALVGHSTGGLDIRRLLFEPTTQAPAPTLLVDGGRAAAKPTEGERGERATEVAVSPSEILDAVDRVVFLSVPQWGTNIADWTRNHRVLRLAVVAQLRLAIETARTPKVDQTLSAVLGQLGGLVQDPDLVLAAQDAIREIAAPRGNLTQRADAQEAASKLRLWLQHAVDDFAAIDDLAAVPPEGSKSPAHYTLEEREAEQNIWHSRQIRTMSFATIGRRPFDFPSGPVEPFAVLQQKTWPNHDLVPATTTRMDVSYLCAYRACAGGPFSYPAVIAGKDCRDITNLERSMFQPTRLAPDGPDAQGRIELWDNDGIVNTASMLWPDGPATVLVAGDHGDIIGHYLQRKSSPEPVDTGRVYSSYDLLKSGTGFTDGIFSDVWNAVFDFCA